MKMLLVFHRNNKLSKWNAIYLKHNYKTFQMKMQLTHNRNIKHLKWKCAWLKTEIQNFWKENAIGLWQKLSWSRPPCLIPGNPMELTGITLFKQIRLGEKENISFSFSLSANKKQFYRVLIWSGTVTIVLVLDDNWRPFANYHHLQWPWYPMNRRWLLLLVSNSVIS